MCASRGLLQKSPALCSSALASKQRFRKQLARPTGQPAHQAVRGLPALQLRKQPSRRQPGSYGRCYAAAETAAVSQGLGSATSGASSSSSSGNAASVSGSTLQSGPGGTANSTATTGGSSSSSTSASPSPLPGSAGAAGQSAGGTSTAGPPGGAGAPAPAPFSVKPVYVLIFTLLFLGGLLFASMSLQLTSDMGFRDALTKVVRRIFR